MKDVISVNDLINDAMYKAANLYSVGSEMYDNVKMWTAESLHSLLISKLPEKKQYNGNVFTVPKYSATEENRKTGYNSAIDDMHRVIDEMFGVQK